MTNTAHRRKPKWWQIAIILPLLPLILALALLALVLFIVASIGLRIVIWSWWCLRGRDICIHLSHSTLFAEAVTGLRRYGVSI
jgi:hypothetical protein